MGRSPELEVLQKYPYCAETPPKYLAENRFWYTPPHQQFERNHNLIPELDIEEYEISLMNARTEDAEEKAIVISFEDLKAMGSDVVTSYLECAGNKRKFLSAEYE